MNMSKALLSAAVIAASLLSVNAAAQSDFPSGRVTIVVPFPAGGPFDTVARLMAPPLQEKWKQPVIVENKPGAGTVVGTESVVKAAGDGRTILINGDVNGMRVFSKISFNPLRDLKPVTKLIAQYFVAVTTPQVPAKTLQEFVAYAKQRPKVLNHAEIPFTQFQIEFPVFMQKAGIEMQAVPYNGAAPIIAALLNNDVQFFLGPTQLLGPHMASGKLTGLAITATKRAPELPNLPTVRETGIDYDAMTWYALYLPGTTPDALVTRISADAAQVINMPEVVARLKPMGFEIYGTTPAEISAEIAASAKTYDDVVKRLGITPQ